MSDETETNSSTETDAEKKAREPKKNSIPSSEIVELTAGIPFYDKASFRVVGHKKGVRLALPLTNGVSRAYFYANNEYGIIPDDEAIRTFSAEERKEQRLGGIMAEVDFELGVEAARRALGKLIDVVRAAPAPAEKPRREKKVEVPTETDVGDTVGEDDATA